MRGLTDTWHGFYNYDGVVVADNPFVASMLDHAGLLSGAITERHPGPRLIGLPLHAAIDGRRTERSVIFTKTYRPVAALPDYQHVRYDGVLSPDDEEIEGGWRIKHMTGRFLMIRANRPLLATRQRVAEWVDQL